MKPRPERGGNDIGGAADGRNRPNGDRVAQASCVECGAVQVHDQSLDAGVATGVVPELAEHASAEQNTESRH